MAALRVMHRADEFELLALNYCITYEVSPHPWEEPQGRLSRLESGDAAPKPGRAASRLAASPRAPAGSWPGQRCCRRAVGESLSTWQRLDDELTRRGARRLVRGPGAHRFRRRRHAAELGHAHATPRAAGRSSSTPIAWSRAFFDVIGIADHATCQSDEADR
jgi:hypothetical protein